jgi:hypothetical protein
MQAPGCGALVNSRLAQAELEQLGQGYHAVLTADESRQSVRQQTLAVKPERMAGFSANPLRGAAF